MAQANLFNIDEDEIRNVLAQHINNHSCLRLKHLNVLKIGEKEMQNAFEYTLETFSEKRETKWKYTRYTGRVIDGIQNGPIPFMWDVKAITPEWFCEKVKKRYTMPHSEEVRTCHRCSGSGTESCSSCGGSGSVTESYTTTEYDSTTETHVEKTETRSVTCSSCFGSGRQTCSTCSGRGELLWYMQLKVTWDTFQNTCYINEIPLIVFPNKLIKKSDGEVIFKECAEKVSQITNFPYIDVMRASEGFIEEHRDKHDLQEDEKIIKQRHQIKALLIAMIDWQYEKKKGKFFIYGNDRKVNFPNYPGNFLRYCSIL